MWLKKVEHFSVYTCLEIRYVVRACDLPVNHVDTRGTTGSSKRYRISRGISGVEIERCSSSEIGEWRNTTAVLFSPESDSLFGRWVWWTGHLTAIIKDYVISGTMNCKNAHFRGWFAFRLVIFHGAGEVYNCCYFNWIVADHSISKKASIWKAN